MQGVNDVSSLNVKGSHNIVSHGQVIFYVSGGSSMVALVVIQYFVMMLKATVLSRKP